MAGLWEGLWVHLRARLASPGHCLHTEVKRQSEDRRKSIDSFTDTFTRIGGAIVPATGMPSTEDELIAAALAMIDAKKGLDRVRVRQSAASEILKAEDKI